ncbi:rad50 [Anaeramoeba flamelloides]|uniref:Rad50 n=1 Tax=Anaeramoeba flamelloides TaxID=1746091 RepID=A0AAV7ZKD2_9EUKA|nr:rad50 [Anaeramoeba flamelloides]
MSKVKVQNLNQKPVQNEQTIKNDHETLPYFTVVPNLFYIPIDGLSYLNYQNVETLEKYLEFNNTKHFKNKDRSVLSTSSSSLEEEEEEKFDIKIESETSSIDEYDAHDQSQNNQNKTKQKIQTQPKVLAQLSPLTRRKIIDQKKKEEYEYLKKKKQKLDNTLKRLQQKINKVHLESLTSLKKQKEIVKESENEMKKTRKRIHDFNLKIGFETAKLTEEMKDLFDQNVESETILKNCKQMIKRKQQEANTINQQLDETLNERNTLAEKERSKKSSLEITNQNIKRQVHLTEKIFNDQIKESTKLTQKIEKFLQHSRFSRKKMKSKISLNGEKMKLNFKVQIQSITEMQSSYNSISRIMNDKISEIHKLGKKYKALSEKESNLIKKINKKNENLKNEKQLKLQIDAKVKKRKNSFKQNNDNNNYYELNFLKNKIKTLDVEILRLKHDKQSIKSSIILKDFTQQGKYNQIQYLGLQIVDILSDNLNKCRENISLIQTENRLICQDIQNSLLPSEYNYYIQQSKSDNLYLINQLEKIESMLF